MKEIKYKDLNDNWKNLLSEAEKALENSYSPYSNFKVGSGVLTEDGKIFTGTNYENASFGATICAERSALLNANSAGYKKLIKIAIIAKSDKYFSNVVSPCGICRQMIYEASKLSNTDIEILMSNPDKSKIILSTISELLPLAFEI